MNLKNRRRSQNVIKAGVGYSKSHAKAAVRDYYKDGGAALERQISDSAGTYAAQEIRKTVKADPEVAVKKTHRPAGK